MKTHRFFSVFLLLILAVSLLTGPASAAEVPDPAIQAKAALLVDANTGRMVYGKNEHEELYPASLTKIMTALLTLEAVDSGQLSMDQPITVTESALEGLAADGSTAGIRAGEVLTVEQLLECMLIVSANEACNILAEQVSGSVDAFVGAMNEKAAALGCENTHFVNTTGLHDSQHYTSAWDLYLITAEALKHDDFLRICDMKSATIPATNLSEERVLHSTNYLISNWRALGISGQPGPRRQDRLHLRCRPLPGIHCRGGQPLLHQRGAGGRIRDLAQRRHPGPELFRDLPSLRLGF